jgi:hypothetical protein
MNQSLSTSSDKFLFVGDPHLGPEGYQLFRQYFPESSHMFWRREEGGTAGLRELIRSRCWVLTISFYNDYLFTREDFPHLGLALNFHPSLPCYRGVGYDHLPLMEERGVYGGTLHVLNPPPTDRIVAERDIDTGLILRVKEKPLPSDATSSQLRKWNQRLLLSMLEELCEMLSLASDLEEVRAILSKNSREHGHQWGSTYTNRRQLETRLTDLKKQTPSSSPEVKEVD